jgi:hypothetical protein
LPLLQFSYAFLRLERVSQDLNFCFQLNEGGSAVTFVIWCCRHVQILMEKGFNFCADFLVFFIVLLLDMGAPRFHFGRHRCTATAARFLSLGFVLLEQ